MMLGLLCIVVLSFAFTAEATEVKIKETVEVDNDFDYINSTADEVETLLDVDFTVEIRNVSMANRAVEMKYFHRFIPVSFTQSKLNDFVKEINKITKSSNPNTVNNDFIKIGAVTSTLLNHGDDPKLSRLKRGCYVRCRHTWRIAAGCETDTSKKFGIGAEVDPFGVKVKLRYKTYCVPVPVFTWWGKRDIQ